MRTVVTRSRRRFARGFLAIAASLASLISLMFATGLIGRPIRDAAEEARAAAEPAGGKEPVILLTGFEPFGKHRLPNASWQGVMGLDGRIWNGYRLVAREMPVVWGAPLEYLPRWIDEYKPVAIFSFGMGGPGAFALETVGHNRRAPIRDNAGKRPVVRAIAPAPHVFHSGIDSRRLAHLLREKGQPVRISTRAGRYLCEENLYSLEYLKKQKDLDATVMFCHVPPLGTKIEGTLVTKDYIQRFVLDVLDSWAAIYRGGRPRALAARAAEVIPTSAPIATVPVVQAARLEAQPAKDEDPQLGEVRTFVDRYFRSWSDQDMNTYDSCFLPEAVIQFVDERGAITSKGKTRFVAEQREVHRRSEVRNIEVPESVEARMEGRLAHAVVAWKLTSGERVQKGYDHFTLLKREGRWRIVNLVFYATAVEE